MQCVLMKGNKQPPLARVLSDRLLISSVEVAMISKADVVVIGSGGLGAATAYYLAKRGGRLYSPATNAPFVYRLGLKIFNLARGVRLP